MSVSLSLTHKSTFHYMEYKFQIGRKTTSKGSSDSCMSPPGLPVRVL